MSGGRPSLLARIRSRGLSRGSSPARSATGGQTYTPVGAGQSSQAATWHAPLATSLDDALPAGHPPTPGTARTDAAFAMAPFAAPSVDAAAIRTEVVNFLDRAEARARRRPEWVGELERERDRQRDEEIERLAAEAHVEACRVLDAARADARELVRRAHGEAEQTLEWSRAQGAEIVRRSQRVAADRFAADRYARETRPWVASELRSR